MNETTSFKAPRSSVNFQIHYVMLNIVHLNCFSPSLTKQFLLLRFLYHIFVLVLVSIGLCTLLCTHCNRITDAFTIVSKTWPPPRLSQRYERQDQSTGIWSENNMCDKQKQVYETSMKRTSIVKDMICTLHVIWHKWKQHDV